MEQLAADIRRALRADRGLAGRESTRVLVEKAIQDADFIAATFGPERTKGYEILYEDAELGFSICAHVDVEPVREEPHDHGDSWAIYGQVEGATCMADWRIIKPTLGDDSPKMQLVRTYELRPGMAHYYDVGAVHEPSRAGHSKLLRVEGKAF